MFSNNLSAYGERRSLGAESTLYYSLMWLFDLTTIFASPKKSLQSFIFRGVL